MLSDKVYNLCRDKETVSSLLAADPNLAPHSVHSKLYGSDIGGVAEHKHFKVNQIASEEDLKRAYECGNWGPTEPSELFLRMYHDAISTLNGDPLTGMVSPPLMGSCGTVPLTIIAPLPDICRHMSNCIARAEHDVFLATNFWMHSEASSLVVNSIRELSRRAGARKHKVVVKIMYDRGSAKQVFNNHQDVPESGWTAKAIQLPPASEIPGIDMQVVNYHRPIFGTFHSKFMVVDRRIAIVSSNNIQDNDNLEMMSHLEGPIVDSFYDVCLNSWHNELDPPLPTHNSPAMDAPMPSFEQESFSGMFDEHGMLRDLAGQGVPKNTTANSRGVSDAGVPLSVDGQGSNKLSAHDETLITCAGNETDLPEHSASDPHYDPDIASEVLRAQSVLSPRNGESRMAAVTRHLNTTIQKDTTGNALECASGDEMTTYIPLPTRDLVPMAMVCRKPWGNANMASVHVPQNEAFLSALRNAKRSVFIQTPNLNAEPLLPAILDAARRGVQVSYYVCLGYNDAGELLPFQGGTNEMIAHKLYAQLDVAGKASLHIYNYVAKDQTAPIHNSFKKRSCHIKLLIADERVCVQGNGNQDTQSWFHSQEVNVMIDSEVVAKAWLEGIRRNQNTGKYGAVGKDDGCWRDSDGKMPEGSIGVDPGKFSWAKGIVGAVQRVRGAGGF